MQIIKKIEEFKDSLLIDIDKFQYSAKNDRFSIIGPSFVTQQTFELYDRKIGKIYRFKTLKGAKAKVEKIICKEKFVMEKNNSSGGAKLKKLL